MWLAIAAAAAFPQVVSPTSFSIVHRFFCLLPVYIVVDPVFECERYSSFPLLSQIAAY